MPKVMAYVWFLTKEQSQIEFRPKKPEFWDTERKEHNNLSFGGLPPNPRDLALW